MQFPQSSTRLAVPLLVVAIAIIPGAVKADTIIFKDGFVLQGKVMRENKNITDPSSGQVVEIGEGFFMIWDGARKTLFSQSHLDRAEDDRDSAPENGEITWPLNLKFVNAKAMPPILGVTDFGEFNDEWDRTLKVSTIIDRREYPNFPIRQHLKSISPYCVHVEPGFNKNVTAQIVGHTFYLTRELGPETVKSILFKHESLKPDPKLSEADRFQRKLKVTQFLAQAGWLDFADGDLDALAKEFPGEKEAVETARKGLKKLVSLQTATELKRLYRGGQYKGFEGKLKGFVEDGVPAVTLQEIRRIKDEYQTTSESIKTARQYLTDLLVELGQTEHTAFFKETTQAIADELSADTVGRLETFVTQAKQAARLKADKKDPGQTPTNLLSFAVSGWLLGNLSAESKPEVAQKLWATRQMVLKYQATHDAAGRDKLLSDYQSNKNAAVKVDELAQVVGLLPPPEPELKIDRAVKTYKVAAQGLGRAAEYQVRLPGEYNHGRPWPVLVVLHATGESPQTMIDRWSELADAHGYILLAPEWDQGINGVYKYSSDEHETVTRSLRDLKQRYNVDSDKVFLFGLGVGGNMAWDVGLSHPDLFAGVLPMSAIPGNFCWRARRNAQFLPFYVVTGDRLPPETRMSDWYKEWIPMGVPLLYNQYLGRGLEWYPAEMEIALDWMNRKERANPVAALGGFNREFMTVRSTDNRFWWLSTNSISPGLLNEEEQFNLRRQGALLRGSCAGNQLNVTTTGLNQVTIWLGRDRRGQYMVDFEKPVTLYLNNKVKHNDKVAPSMKVLLEDLYERGDKQRLYVARLDYNKP